MDRSIDDLDDSWWKNLTIQVFILFFKMEFLIASMDKLFDCFDFKFDQERPVA